MKTRTLLSMLSLCIVALPGAAQAGSLEELLVQKGVISRSEAAAATASTAAKVYYKNGTRVDFADTGSTFGINTFIQTRYGFTDHEEGENTSSFKVNRARLIASGSALNKEFEYYLQGEFAGASASLKDAYLKWNIDKDLALRMGQYKTPISRQFVTSDYAIQFADRSLASDYFDLDRNQGLEATFSATPDLKLGAAIFNGLSTGEGINKTGVDTKHTGAVFFRADLAGKMDPFKEGDLDVTEGMAVNVGGAYAYSDFQATATGAPSVQHDGHSVSLDANLKSEGMSVHSEFFWAKDEPEGADSASPLGGYVQGGYLLADRKTELAARYSLVSCDDGAAAGDCSGLDQIQEVTLGLNYHFSAHNLKAQFNYVYTNKNPTESDLSDENDNRLVVQLSAYL